MRFDLVDLQLFIAVADARSITQGAARAHLALASASERIKGLEQALGVALLKRGRRGVDLTAAGESLLDHARVVIHSVEALRGMAQVLALQKKPGAVAMAERALAGAPQSGAVLETLSLALAAENNLERAIDVQVRSGLRIGYIMGSGDDVPEALQQLGVPYDLKVYARDPRTRLAPAALRKVLG